MLVLPIKKKWYDMILSGEKTEEYREIKPYYDSRFESVFGCQWLFRGIDGVGDTTPPEKEIIFRNGYSRSSRQAKATCTLTKGTGNPEWGAEPGVKYYVLHIKKIQEAYETDHVIRPGQWRPPGRKYRRRVAAVPVPVCSFPERTPFER